MVGTDIASPVSSSASHSLLPLDAVLATRAGMGRVLQQANVKSAHVEPGLEGSHPGLLLLLAAVPIVLLMTISPNATKVRPAILGISSRAGVRTLKE